LIKPTRGMDIHKDLDDIIKSSFGERSKGAPEGLWTKLSSVLDETASPQMENNLPPDPVDEKVKESFSALNEKAPRDIWPAINKQLNIEKVWRNISQELDNSRPVFWPVLRVAAAVLLLLLSGLGAYVLMTNSTFQKGVISVRSAASTAQEITSQAPLADKVGVSKEKGVSSHEIQHSLRLAEKVASPSGLETYSSAPSAVLDGSIAYQKPVISSKSTAKENAIAKAEASMEQKNQPLQSETSAHPPVPQSESIIVIGNENSDAEIISSEDLLINATAATAPDITPADSSFILLVSKRLPVLPEEGSKLLEDEVSIVDAVVVEDVTLAESGDEPEDKKNRRKLRLKDFGAGLVTVYHNSWLLNNETKNSFDKNSLIATDKSYKQNFGLAINYNLSERSVLAAEVHLVNKAGQNYRIYHNGDYIHKGLELRYYKLYVQYQRNFLRYGSNMPGWFTIKAGAYGGYLQAKLGEIRQEESRYSKYDYGVRMALGQEKQVGKFILGYGFSAERGLNNIFMGTDKLPANFNKTYSMNFGTYLNCRYNF
jgi:hypothetical protein